MNLAVKLIFMSFIGGTFQQDATSLCESENQHRISWSGAGSAFSSYSGLYDRTARYKCSFQYIKSPEDMAIAITNQTSYGLRVNTIVFLNSSLSRLPDKMFSSFSTVRKVDASRLVLDEISATTFNGIRVLDFLDLSNNKLKKLTDKTFASMQIKLLDLSLNYIESISDMTFITADIEKLNLAFNQIKSLKFLNAFSFFNMVQLGNNNIENIKIETKPDGWLIKSGIFGDPEFPKIFLDNNKITKLDCASTIKIETLNLQKNPLLTDVALNLCRVDEIDISDCGSIKKVSLNDNLLGFTAKNVQLTDIDFSTAKLLSSLLLANTSIPQSVVEKVMKLENLSTLDLSYVQIGPLNVSTFAKLKSLQFLYLKATNISNIQFGTFSHQTAVKVLDLSDNHLKIFDMNMIFSMTNLISLDLSGNELVTLENVESAHFTFTMLQKIDLSNNNWPCSYLMRLIKIFRVYKVGMMSSTVEESGSNIHGVACIHGSGNENFIEPLSPDSANITDLRNKMNELVSDATNNAQFRIGVESRLKQLEGKVDNQVKNVASALHHDDSHNIEVKNSALLESTLVIVCICCAAFMAVKFVDFVRRNFLGHSRQMRSTSEHILAMNVDDY